MDPFTKSLKANIETALGRAPAWGRANPLVVIGLTEAMLDLGLTEDQMYAAVHSYVRQLARQVHPDTKQTNVTAERQREIIEAFDILDDRETFSKALKEFRELKAEDRREANILRRSLLQAQETVRRIEGKEVELTHGLRGLENDRKRFEMEEGPRKALIPQLQNDVRDLLERNSLAHSWGMRWKKRYDRINDYLSSLATNQSLPDSGVNVFDAKWVAIVSLVPKGIEYAEPLNKSGKWGRAFQIAISPLGLSQQAQQDLLGSWQTALGKYGEPDPKELGRSRDYNLWLSVFELTAGKTRLLFGFEQAIGDGRVLGCTLPDSESVSRRSLIRTVHTDSLFENLSPFLVSERLLVSRRIKGTYTGAGGKVRTQTKMIILAVG